jgi:thiamine-monophosphate kinase
MLMDGVDFDARIHTPQQIGRKALAVSLSDCAAMAVRPRWVSVTVALPDNWSIEQAQGLYLGMEPLAEAHCCRIIGGDTNSWSQGLVIETCVVAEPWPGLEPVRRGGVRPGDWICVTGVLGGSLAGHHLEFEPAVATAFNLATGFKGRLKAMMDISDGLSIDAARMARASACTIQLEEAGLGLVVSDAAIAASRADHRTPLEHALHDGEDFELLFALAPEAATALGPGQAAVTTPAGNAVVAYTVIGRAEKGEGLWLLDMSGHRRRIEPAGWQHFVK